jgi:hypothetical protein
MNLAQRIVVGAVGIAALLMMLYPPFYVRAANGVLSNLGYHFLLDPPSRSGPVFGLVHVPTLLVQFVALVIVGAAAWFAVGGVKLRKRPPQAEPRFNPARAAEIMAETELAARSGATAQSISDRNAQIQ